VLAVLCPCLVPLPRHEWDDASSSSSDYTSRPSSGGTQPGDPSRPQRPLLGKATASAKSESGSALSLSRLKLGFTQRAARADGGDFGEGDGWGKPPPQPSPVREGEFLVVEEWDGVQALPPAQVRRGSLSVKLAGARQ